MLDITENTLNRLDAFNNWLSDVYGEETKFNTVLLDEGFSEAEIEQLHQEHLNEFLPTIVELLDSYRDQTGKRGKIFTMQYYGLVDGNPQDLHTIGENADVSLVRIRQLINQRVSIFRHAARKEQLWSDIGLIGRCLLDTSTGS